MEIRINGLEVRVNQENKKIYVAGYLPVNQLSDVILDKEGKQFREKINKGCFSRALIKKQEQDNKIKFLVNHDYDQEIPYEEFEWEELSDRLRFLFTLSLEEGILEKLKDLGEAKLSFGFKVGNDRNIIKNKKIDGYDYERIIDDMVELMEISILDKKIPAYPQSKAFSGSEEVVKEATAKEELKRMREEISKLQQAELERYKEFIKRKRSDDRFRKIAGY